MPASDVMKSLHERMPAIIAPTHYDPWLDARITEKNEITRYLNSALSSQLVAYPVSPWVNTPKYDDERCVQPSVKIWKTLKDWSCQYRKSGAAFESLDETPRKALTHAPAVEYVDANRAPDPPRGRRSRFAARHHSGAGVR
jgi:hypothetical protein